MSLLGAWLLFPALLGIVAVGCGLLVERAARVALSRALLLPVGLAAIIVVAGFLTLADATAELATPAILGLAAAGLLLSHRGGPALPRRGLAAGAALAAYAAYAAPVVLSGEATFAGYIKLDDTATWLAQVDHVMKRGRSLAGLAPSTYEATLSFSVADGYPIGAMLPLGVGAAISGQDVAWVFQPYLALLAGALALPLYELLGEMISRPWIRATAAVIAAQPALLFGFALWGGIKELAVAVMVATLAALLAVALRETGRGGRGAIACAALPGAALLGIFTLAGGVWVGALLLVSAPAALSALGGRTALVRGATLAGLIVALGAPGFVPAAAWLKRAATELTQTSELGNLVVPLSALQALGIWLTGDFRLFPSDPTPTLVLLAVLGATALGGVLLALRSRAVGVTVLVWGAVLGAAALVLASSPWVDAKALAVASPAPVLAALAATGVLWERSRRVESAVITLAIGAGVITSNALAYHEVWLAPRAQLAELEQIGTRLAGQGPTLMTGYEPYGVRHFLRRADAEGASELRRRRVPLRDGSVLDKGAEADVDRFSLPDLLVYRSLVLRRSPLASRPPSSYRRVWQGRHWEAWQQHTPRPIIEHVALGRAEDPSARVPCATARRLARLAGPGGQLTAAWRPRPIVVPLDGGGELATTVDVPRNGVWQAWVGGSFRRRLSLHADDTPVGEARHRLGTAGAVWPLGPVRLSVGKAELELREEKPGLRPGSGGVMYPHGPVILARAAAGDTLKLLPARGWRRLCGQRLDWIEALGPLASQDRG
jgi:hypothetical protein